MKARLYLCLLAVLSSVAAHGGDTDADKTKLLALENAWNIAQIQHDSKALEVLVSDRYVYTDDDGTVMDKAQFLADNKDPEYNATLMTNDDVQVISYPNAAVVIGKYHAKGTYKGKAFDYWGRFTDTWLYQLAHYQKTLLFPPGPILPTPDGKSYVYGYRHMLSDLYVVDGLKCCHCTSQSRLRKLLRIFEGKPERDGSMHSTCMVVDKSQ